MIERWNDPNRDFKAIMMRSKEGRELLEKRSVDKMFKAKIEEKKEEKERRAVEKRFLSKYKPQTFAGVLADMTRCNGFSDPNTHYISNDAEEILVRSGVPTSAAGFFLPLDPEYRAINATNAPLAEFIAAFNRSMKENLILDKLGITRLPNLVGKAKVTEYTGSTAKWANETGAAENGKGTFSKIELTPKRLTAYLNVSRLELAQTTGLATFLADDLARSVSEAIEKAVFGNEAHSDNRPDGFFTGKTITPVDCTYDNILSIEAAVKNNGIPMAWAMNGQCERMLKKAQRNGSSIIAGSLCSDRSYQVSDLIPTITAGSGQTEETSECLVYGRWKDFYLASWGALEVIYNPYTQAINGLATFIVNYYTDWTWKDISFKTAALKTA